VFWDGAIVLQGLLVVSWAWVKCNRQKNKRIALFHGCI
jgi:hypothetical protein